MPGLAAFLFLGLHLRQLRRLHAELEEILHFNPLRTVHRPAAIHSAEFGHLALDLLLGRHLSLQEVLLQQRQRQSRRGQDLGWALDLRRLRRLRRRRGLGHRGWHRAPRQGPQHAAQPRADLCHGGRHRSEKDLMPTFVGTRLRAALAVGEHINAQHTLHQIGASVVIRRGLFDAQYLFRLRLFLFCFFLLVAVYEYVALLSFAPNPCGFLPLVRLTAGSRSGQPHGMRAQPVEKRLNREQLGPPRSPQKN